jgi:hypothetical protein
MHQASLGFGAQEALEINDWTSLTPPHKSSAHGCVGVFPVTESFPDQPLNLASKEGIGFAWVT